MKKMFLMTAVIFCLSFLLCACADDSTNNETNTNNSTDTPEKIETSEESKLLALKPTAYSHITGLNLEPGSSISIIGRYADDSFWTQVEAGANYAVDALNKALGYTGSDKIKLTYSAPNNRDDVNEQINILDEELARYPIAIGIAAIDTGACTLQFDLASENNIPIITVDSGSDYHRVAAHIATNNQEAASTAASKLANAIGDAGEVAVFVQDSTSMTAKERESGFVSKIANEFPDVSIVQIYHLDELKSIAETVAQDMTLAVTDAEVKIDSSEISQEDVVKWVLEKNPNLKGIYTTNLDTTQLVAKVVKDMERTDLTIIGFDGGEEQLALLENDVIDGLILQNPFGMGYATVVAAARVALDLGNEAFIDTGYTWVTKDNLTEAPIANMLY